MSFPRGSAFSFPLHKVYQAALPHLLYHGFMPSGRVHETINLTVLGGGVVAYLVYGGSPGEPRALALALAYLAGTFLLSPDLDLAEKGTRSQRRWGPLGLLWRPYGRLFRHRGLSHTWVLGPFDPAGVFGGAPWGLRDSCPVHCRVSGHGVFPEATLLALGSLGFCPLGLLPFPVASLSGRWHLARS